jgi:hypothetical protein
LEALNAIVTLGRGELFLDIPIEYLGASSVLPTWFEFKPSFSSAQVDFLASATALEAPLRRPLYVRTRALTHAQHDASCRCWIMVLVFPYGGWLHWRVSFEVIMIMNIGWLSLSQCRAGHHAYACSGDYVSGYQPAVDLIPAWQPSRALHLSNEVFTQLIRTIE